MFDSRSQSAGAASSRRWGLFGRPVRLGLCAGLLALAGCAGARQGVDQPQLAHATPFEEADPLVSPVVRGGENGLELRWWVLAEADTVSRALAAYVHQPSPLDDEVAQVWRDNGLRLVRVPLDDVAALRRTLPIAGRVDRHWLGQIPGWTEAVRGAALGSSVTPGLTCLIDGRRSSLGAGRLRLLARSWTVACWDGPRLRTELALQHLESRRSGLDPFFELTGRPGIVDEGRVFFELTAEMTLEPGFAYIIAPERPEVDWVDTGTDSEAELWRSLASPALEYGPEAPRLPTLGEAMLREASHFEHGRDVVALLVITPRVPEELRLLP